MPFSVSHLNVLDHPFPTDDGPGQHHPTPSGSRVTGLLTLCTFHLYHALMNKLPIALLLPVVLALVCGCSSNQKNEIPQGYLATQITDDGSKQFVYTADFPDTAKQGKRSKGNGRPGNVSGNVQGSSNRGVSGGVSVGTGGGGKGGRGGRGQQGRASLLNDALEAELKKTGYCREGYMELDRMMQPYQTFIKGECVETATVKDREAFPNQLE